MELIKKTVEFCKDNLLMTAITAAAVLLTVLTFFIAVIFSAKAKKAKKRALQAAKSAPQPVEEKTEEVSVAEVPVAATPIAEEISAPIVEEKAEKTVVTPTAEEKAEEIPAPVVKKTTPKAKKATAKKETPTAKAPIVKEEKADALEKAPTAEEKPVEKTEETVQAEKVRYAGKWAIFRLTTDEETEEENYFFELRASNGETLLSSEEYTSYAGVLRGIQTHKTNILRDNFKITVSKKGDYIFKLLSGKNLLLCTGANYSTRARCESAVASVKRFAETAVLDENVQEHFIKTQKDDGKDLPKPSEGVTGKWIVNSVSDDRGDAVYYFELFANNGEKLLSSEEYTTYIGAINGIETHKKNIAIGNFRISLTKRGDYIYKILNGNGQLLCLGEHYKTKRLCQNAVESVKRFALNSPTLTAQSNLK